MATVTHTVEVDVTFTLVIELDSDYDDFDMRLSAEYARSLAEHKVQGVIDSLENISKLIDDTTGPGLQVGVGRVLEDWEVK